MMDAKYDNQEYFFAARGDWLIELCSFGHIQTITVDEMYSHFKARIMSELNLSAN